MTCTFFFFSFFLRSNLSIGKFQYVSIPTLPSRRRRPDFNSPAEGTKKKARSTIIDRQPHPAQQHPAINLSSMAQPKPTAKCPPSRVSSRSTYVLIQGNAPCPAPAVLRRHHRHRIKFLRFCSRCAKWLQCGTTTSERGTPEKKTTAKRVLPPFVLLPSPLGFNGVHKLLLTSFGYNQFSSSGWAAS